MEKHELESRLGRMEIRGVERAQRRDALDQEAAIGRRKDVEVIKGRMDVAETAIEEGANHVKNARRALLADSPRIGDASKASDTLRRLGRTIETIADDIDRQLVGD
jgi:hypothetical protein